MRKVNVKVCNKSKNVLPKYTTEFSAGFDIRVQLNPDGKYVGNNLWTIDPNDNHVTLMPGGRILIPTGLYVAIPDGYELQIRPRSGLAINKGITILNSPGTIDSDYRGEIGLIILNTDPNSTFDINDGERLAQGVLNEVDQVEWDEVDTIESLGETERQDGGFGHSGKN